jgi:hypothetical protein
VVRRIFQIVAFISGLEDIVKVLDWSCRTVLVDKVLAWRVVVYALVAAHAYQRFMQRVYAQAVFIKNVVGVVSIDCCLFN